MKQVLDAETLRALENTLRGQKCWICGYKFVTPQDIHEAQATQNPDGFAHGHCMSKLVS